MSESENFQGFVNRTWYLSEFEDYERNVGPLLKPCGTEAVEVRENGLLLGWNVQALK